MQKAEPANVPCECIVLDCTVRRCLHSPYDIMTSWHRNASNIASQTVIKEELGYFC